MSAVLPSLASSRQRGFLSGHEEPRRTGTRGPHRASCSSPLLASGLSAKEWEGSLNRCFPSNGVGDTVIPSVAPPAAGLGRGGSADTSKSMRAMSHSEKRETTAGEAGMVAVSVLCNLTFFSEESKWLGEADLKQAGVTDRC